MPDQMPPPGPERDAEIARLLGDDIEERAEHVDVHEIDDSDSTHETVICGRCHATACALCEESLPATCQPRPRGYSTGSISSDRLVEEMVRRGWWVTVESQPNEKIFASVHRGYDYDVMIDAQTANGTTRPDAVSAAALLALRGGA